MELCLAYVPRRAELYTLDALGWLLVMTCGGKTVAEVAASYQAVMREERSAAEALEEIEAAFLRLRQWGIVEVEQPGIKAKTRRAHNAEQD